ncbi:hypothetical protein ACFVDI_05345 [Nocardioides sp. NPDC057767]|uniref:hypothetical protein n=1 Tax=unclassified Nocardioides TaxID=2615069 RepID=UPI00366E04C6
MRITVPRPRRARAVLMLTTVGVIGVAVALATESGGSTSASDHNVAFVSGAATDEVVEMGRTTAAEVFTIQPGDVAATRRRAQEALVGDAAGQYDRLYGSHLRAARARRISLTTTVRDVGVVWLRDDRAKLLVFADQAASTPSGQSATGPAQFALDLQHIDGTWKISSIRLL